MKKSGGIMKLPVLLAAAGVVSVLAILGGCSHTTSDTAGTVSESGMSDGESSNLTSPEETRPSETPESTSAETIAATDSAGGTPPVPKEEARIKIVTATDVHYLADSLSGNRGESFMSYVNSNDGRVLQYGWEILDAFIEDMLREKPDLIVLSGDLTLNGERKSHEELSDKLQKLLENDIPVIVIPGNHDINNHEASDFTSEGAEKTETVTAEEFADIYADFGYVAADSRDPASLSYTYKLDDYYWLLMLDSCQYEPANQVGGMIKSETYDWIETQLGEAWEAGAQVITVSHHNLLDQSGVSRDFYDNCTIEHNEQLLGKLYDGEVRLHLSGHLHLQHYMQDEDTGIWEIVTGSLVMAPCRYGVLNIMESGDYRYTAQSVDVSGWAKNNAYKNRNLTDFSAFAEQFLRQVTYRNAVLDLRAHTSERKLFLSDERIGEMARFYAELCVHYYGGRMYEIAESMKTEKAYAYWNEVDYISDLSSFLRNILEDEVKDFSHLEIPY